MASQFLADPTNGRAIGTMLRPSVVLSVVSCRVYEKSIGTKNE